MQGSILSADMSVLLAGNASGARSPLSWHKRAIAASQIGFTYPPPPQVFVGCTHKDMFEFLAFKM